MSVSSDHNSNYKGDPATIYSVTESTVPGRDAVVPAPTAASTMPANAPRIDAVSIRWGWWAASLGLSAALWAGIAIGLF